MQKNKNNYEFIWIIYFATKYIANCKKQTPVFPLLPPVSFSHKKNIVSYEILLICCSRYEHTA